MILHVDGYTTDSLLFNWGDGAVVLSSKVELPQFMIVETVRKTGMNNFTTGKST